MEISTSIVLIIAIVLLYCVIIVIAALKRSSTAVSIELDVAFIDRRIDYHRGQLEVAQQNDDLESETIALIRIDAYQDIRISHGLERLPEI